MSKIALALDYTTHGKVALLRLNRPARRNAISWDMWKGFVPLLARAQLEKDTHAIIITGAGAHFCAGADITEFETLSKSKTRASQYRTAIQKGLQAIETCAKPVLAAVEGDCMGGGVSVAMACDYVIAGAQARFAVPAARLGLVYPVDDTRRLLARLGLARTKDLLWRARPVSVRVAQSWGLIDASVARGQALRAAQRYCQDMAGLSQWSIRASKKMLELLATPPQPRRNQALARLGASGFDNEDFRIGYRAFLNKTRPKFSFR